MIVVNDGYQLAEKAGEHRPHLIITDIQMPGAYGSSAYLVLQNDAATKNIPVIFMSGHARMKLEKLLPNDPKTRFVQKPTGSRRPVRSDHGTSALGRVLPLKKTIKPYAKVGVIGGSGLYSSDALINARELRLKTPFGAHSGPIVLGDLEAHSLRVPPRHGHGHVVTRPRSTSAPTCGR